MIAIIGAMQEEIDAILTHLHDVESIDTNITTVFKGTFQNQQILVGLSGIGKVNAALTAYLLIHDFKATKIINIGTAGGLKKGIKQLDLVVATELVQHDFNVTGGVSNRLMGEIPGLPPRFKTDDDLLRGCYDVINHLGLTSHQGLIASGDQFVHDKGHYETILKHFPDCVAVEMEAAAIAQTCYKTKTPFIITRCISDVVFEEENGLSFEAYLEKASNLSAQLCFGLIDHLI